MEVRKWELVTRPASWFVKEARLVTYASSNFQQVKLRNDTSILVVQLLPMSLAGQINALIRPPDEAQCVDYAASILNQTFISLDQVQSLNESIASHKAQVEEYQIQVSHEFIT